MQNNNECKTVSWFSAGISSFVAAYIMRDKLDEIIYIDVANQHPDSMRFVKDCERLLDMPITILRDTRYGASVDNVIEQTRYINSPYGANCTMQLKKRVRKDFPDVFKRRAKQERLIGHSCINGVYLDELEPNTGNMNTEIMPDCSIMCYLLEQEL